MKLLGIFALLISLISTDLFAANSDKTVFITGSNRGIGYGLTQHYAEQGYQVIATARSPGKATQLQDLAKKHSNIVIEQFDVTDYDRLDALAKQYKDTPIDIVINNAGIKPGGPQGIDNDRARLMFEVNALAPIKIAKALMPHVEASEEKKIITISTAVASMASPVPMPIMWDYRASKAAVNSYMVTLALETQRKGIIVTMLHPGAVNTEWEAQNQEAPKPAAGDPPGLQRILIKESASKLTDIIAGLTMEDNGGFYSYEGKEVIPF